VSAHLPVVGAVLAGLGFLTMFVGAVGLVRWPDVYTRLHAAHAAAALGAPLALAGLALAAPTFMIAVKIVALGALIVALSPTAVQIIGAAAHNSGATARVGLSERDGRRAQK
jgi:multicomponent Na+:H+ antiporter subunit G